LVYVCPDRIYVEALMAGSKPLMSDPSQTVRLPTSQADQASPHPEEAHRAVSKDAPDVSGASWSILRDAANAAPQDEGSENYGPASEGVALPADVAAIETRSGRLVKPKDRRWDDLFDRGPLVSEDFMSDWVQLPADEREPF
jgi:virulence-associated protein VagC